MTLQTNKTDPSTSRADSSVLDLVVAWELPTSLDLEGETRAAVDATLTELENELEAKDPRSSALAKLIEISPRIDVGEHEISETRSSLSSEEVRAYDRYFDVRHVDTACPAMTLVQSLLMTCHAFLVLRETDRDFDPQQIENQTAGFREHARLIRRICGLEPAG